jgi:hypothetical protein
MSKSSPKQKVEQLQGWLSFVKAEAIQKGKRRN